MQMTAYGTSCMLRHLLLLPLVKRCRVCTAAHWHAAFALGWRRAISSQGVGQVGPLCSDTAGQCLVEA